jgi:hypothetical protein
MLLLLFFFKHCRRCAPLATIHTYNSRGQRIFTRWRLFSKWMHLLTHGTNLRVCFLSYKSSSCDLCNSQENSVKIDHDRRKVCEIFAIPRKCLKINQARKVCQNQVSVQGIERERNWRRRLHEMFQNEDFVISLSLYKHPILLANSLP